MSTIRQIEFMFNNVGELHSVFSISEGSRYDYWIKSTNKKWKTQLGCIFQRFAKAKQGPNNSLLLWSTGTSFSTKKEM